MNPLRRLTPAAATLALLALPSTAGAVPVAIDGAPLNVLLGPNGNLQARFDGEAAGQFFSPSSDEANAGFQLVIDPQNPSATTRADIGSFTPVGEPAAVTGSGSAADPYRQVTTFAATTALGETITVAQTATYVNGENGFSLRWDVTSDSAGGAVIRPTLAADLYVSGSDSGVGFLTAGPPRVVGGTNPTTGVSGGISEITPWTRFEEDHYATVLEHSRDTTPENAFGLDNSISSELLDNGVGVQFAEATVCASCPAASYEARWVFLPAPVAGETVNMEPVRGTVLVRLPRGASASRYGLDARTAQRGGFIPLQEARSLPVGSIVNANKGELKLTSAADLQGSAQSANVYSGTFQIIQKRARRPVTEMVLKGGTYRGCPSTRRGKGAQADTSARRRSSRSRVRRLWGNGKGRFRTRGRYSSATVRGTKWLVEDRCGGTLTRVPRRPRGSRVDVRDLVRRKTVRLRAGQSYLARPRAAKRRR